MQSEVMLARYIFLVIVQAQVAYQIVHDQVLGSGQPKSHHPDQGCILLPLLITDWFSPGCFLVDVIFIYFFQHQI